MYENKYREYLSDDTFHRQYLSNEDEPSGSSFLAKLGVAAGAAVGLGYALKKGYDNGLLRDVMSGMIDMAAKFRKTQGQHIMAGIRNWADDDSWKNIERSTGGFWSKRLAEFKQFGKLPEELARAHEGYLNRTAQLDGSPFVPDQPKLIREWLNRNHVLNTELPNSYLSRDMSSAGYGQTVQRAEKMMDDEFINHIHNLTADQQSGMMKRTGKRLATVGDMLHEDSGIDATWRGMLTEMKDKYGDKIVNKYVDEGIYVDNHNRFSDVRDFRNTVSDFANSIAEDFTIPFIKINPIRMFYLNEFTRMDTKPLFTVLKASDRQVIITGGNAKMGKDMLFMNGKVFDLTNWDTTAGTFKKMESNGYLLNAKAPDSPLVRASRMLFNVQTSTFETPRSGFGKFWANVMGPNGLDIGFQPEKIGGEMTWTEPTSPFSSLARKIHEITKPYTARSDIDLDHAFGDDPQWLFMRSYKKPGETSSASEYWRQMWADRTRHEDVTTASFFSYTYFERLNSTLNQVGLGLSSQNLSSPHGIFLNLLARRVAPVWLGIEAIKHSNYVFESMFGEEYEDGLAKFYVNGQVQGAKIKDALGITDFAKRASSLMPGVEFLGELPIPVITTEGITPVMMRDILPMDKTSDELKTYYESGEEPVRKGRYWENGNTPFVGGKIDYYQPNWYRRITSDWQYTDTLWGSKDEYWANSALPSITHPLAPIRHFFTDPYHWEKKHYEDRPYMMTGGIPELESIPLFGKLVNATIGQIFKPARVMHDGEAPNAYKETDSYALAEKYGLITPDYGFSDGIASFSGQGSDTPVAGTGDSKSGGDSKGTVVNEGLQEFYSSVTHGMGQGLGGYQAVQQLNQPLPLAYITSSGNIQLMKKTGNMDVRKINEKIKETSIMKTGQAEMLRLQNYGDEVPVDEALLDTTGIHGALDDIHYNMAEMGGFYGWITGMATNVKDSEQTPWIETSNRAYGYQRGFWDLDLGNMGSDANEIFRRFLPRDSHKNYVNEIDNNMPTWIPGEEYFTDFSHGDPYTKVKKGEMRLPGESYEVLYGIDSEKLDKLELGGSYVGYDKETIVKHLLHRDDLRDMDAMDAGTKLHKTIERDFTDRGVAVQTEGYVKDEAMGIGGFYDMYADQKKLLKWAFNNADVAFYGEGTDFGGHYANPLYLNAMQKEEQDAFIEQMAVESPFSTVDIKTRSERQFGDVMKFENTQQVNFYAGQLGTRYNAIIEYNRDDEAAKPRVHIFGYNPALLKSSYQRVAEARQDIKHMMKDGVIGRGDLYDPIDRFRILADVAPYSQQYRNLSSQIREMGLSEEEAAEVGIIKKQVASRKKRVPMYDYKFSTANVEEREVTVSRVINNNMFMTEELPDNPIKFAGVYIPMGKDDPIAQEATRVVNQYVKPGQKIKISITADELDQVNSDTYQTVSAVIHRGSIRNLNKELLNRGLAKEKANDNSAAGIRARFTPSEIAFGSTWEALTHLDTPFHTKLMQVRSPLEQYKRREVYGKDWQDWASPVQDYAIPWFQNWISHNPLAAVSLGALMGSLFGTRRYGQIVGAVAGGTIAAIGAGYVGAYEGVTGETWIPDRRVKERNIEEYVDILKFVKYNALYRQSADESKKQGFDVDAYLEKKKQGGEYNKMRINQLLALKRDIVRGDEKTIWKAKRAAAEELGISSGDDIEKAINQEITKLRNDREVGAIPMKAAEAIGYHSLREKTMYGYDPGEPIANVLAALPKKDREYLTRFIAAPEEERPEILGVVPGYMKRILQTSWGMEADPKPGLDEYFQHHELPDAKWIGWDPRANLEDVKVKLVKHEALDNSDFDIWQDDERRAAMTTEEMRPNLNVGDKAAIVKHRLREILGNAGFEDLQIEVNSSAKPGIHADINVRKDRRAEILQQLNENGHSLLG